MKSSKFVFSLITVSLMFLSFGCKGGGKTSDKESKDSTTTLTNLIKLDEKMMGNIKTEAVCEIPMPTLLAITGKVQCNEDQMNRVLAPVSGQVLNLKVKIGDTVNKGDILFYINSRDVATAVSECLASQKDLDLAEKNYAMTKDLFEHQASSHISLQQAENELAKTKVQAARAEESLRVLGVNVNEVSSGLNSLIPIRASINGTIIERHLTEGQFVQPDNNPLVTITNLSSLWILADIYERDLRLVKVGQKAEVTTAAYPELCFVAYVSNISDIVDATTRTVKVRFLVTNSNLSLKPEMFASVSLFLEESTRVLTVPEKAVFTEGGQNFVYAGTDDREFSRKQVEVTSDESGRLKVLSGLKAGEKVVSEGALLLSLQEDKIN